MLVFSHAKKTPTGPRRPAADRSSQAAAPGRVLDLARAQPGGLCSGGTELRHPVQPPAGYRPALRHRVVFSAASRVPRANACVLNTPPLLSSRSSSCLGIWRPQNR
ncbi:hypothetical protein Veis_4343 [Verminephrobacter eiseniae EF01-2]|uniref:Uncharacterized protein n=1 Tax=Verminephrobacter eiseniae (strain EF01-2) TaxID=391735 RepID=A1WQY9_VEREI|nr:hypothetical protein Veis_4343 [Verminephrobacter eiseniae EF01-2]